MNESADRRERYRVGDLLVDVGARRVVRGGRSLHLPALSFDLLAALIRAAPEVVSIERLMDQVWAGLIVAPETVSKRVTLLRDVLGDDIHDPRYVTAVRGRGYCLSAPVTAIANESEVPDEAAVAARRMTGQRPAVLLVVLLALVAAWWSLERVGHDGLIGVAESLDALPNSIAVLPFTNLGSDPEQEYFAVGISEEILNRLASFRELKVIARTSSFAFKDSDYDIARISRLLGVEYVLQGSVRSDGNQLRIAAQLVDRTGLQLWIQTFDRESGGIFAIQDEIAEAVATSIAPQLTPPRRDSYQPDLEAYQEYLIGRDMMARRIPGFALVAPQRFTRAIELDPRFAEPYVERALGRIFATARAGSNIALEFERGQQDIETALALKPDLARAHAVRAILLFYRHPDSHAEQEATLRRALELDPNLADAWYWLNWPLTGQRRFNEAYEALERAVRLEPLGPAASLLASIEASRGNFVEAERRLLRLLEIPQPSGPAYQALIGFYMHVGRLVEAIELIKRYNLSMTSHIGRPAGHHRLVLAYGLLGLRAQAEYWHDRWERDWPEEANQIRLYRSWYLGRVLGFMDYREAVAQFRETLQSAGMETASLPRELATSYGILLSLSGEFEEAIRTMEFFTDAKIRVDGLFTGEITDDARLALAWAWSHRDAAENSREMLGQVDLEFREMQAVGELHISEQLFNYALNTLMLGEPSRALERLQMAMDAGWRGYYAAQRDPRWDSLRSDPRFQGIMARVKADLDAQRAEVEAIDAEDDFIARLEGAIASHSREVD